MPGSKISLVLNSQLKIYVDKTASAEERDEKAKSLNRRLRLGGSRRLQYEDYRSFSQIAEIHEDYVMYGQGYTLQGFLDLSTGEQEEQEITTYSPIPLMIQSLGEMLEERANDLKVLKETIMNANP